MQSKKIRTIIADDERPARETLANYLKEYCPSVEIVAECNDVANAYAEIVQHTPDLVFLDIEMPNGSGFDLLRKFSKIDFTVIFITAYSEYAVQAFRFSAVDYLMKPLKISELIDAVAKVERNLSLSNSAPGLETLLQNLGSSPNNVFKNLVIPNLKGFKVVQTDEIIMCEADGYCTNFYLSDKSKITSSHNLKFYEECLTGSEFLRVHNSYLINKQHVKGYSSFGEIHLANGLSCPLGTSRKQLFLEQFRNHSK